MDGDVLSGMICWNKILIRFLFPRNITVICIRGKVVNNITGVAVKGVAIYLLSTFFPDGIPRNQQ